MTTTTAPDAPPTEPPHRPRRFSGWQKALIALLGILVLLVFAGAGFLAWTSSKIDRIPAADLQSLVPVAGETRTFLIVGSDSRDSLPEDFNTDFFGDFAGARADVIMLARFDPDSGVKLLSLPRDLKVTIPGRGTDKINAAYAFGGPDLLVETVRQETGVSINHYVEIDFGGFASVVDALGGVEMDFAYPARDDKSGLSVPEAGTHTLNGEQALAFARSRSYQELQDGRWKTVGGNDIARTGRQQQLIVEIFQEATDLGNAFDLPRFAATFAEQITADEGLTSGVILGLGRAALSLDVAGIERATLPVTITEENGVSYVVARPALSAQLLEAFTNGTPFAGLQP
jgi:LCP family protein required for cell wall assembly